MDYSRQEVLIGKKAQQLLQKSTVAIVGVGALGTVEASLLARAGVSLILIDRDIVEEHNLQRQILYDQKDIGKPKAEVAKEKLQLINPEVKVTAFVADLDYKNIASVKADLFLDGTDNMDTRFLIDEYCYKEKLPWVYAGAVQDRGSVYVIAEGQTRFSTIFRNHYGAQTCETGGVLNTVTTTIAAIATSEAIKVLTKQPFEERMIRYNATTQELLKVAPPPYQKIASFSYLTGKVGARVIKMCGSNMYQVKGRKVDITKVKGQRFGSCVKVGENFVFADGRVLIKASSEERAKAKYSQLVG